MEARARLQSGLKSLCEIHRENIKHQAVCWSKSGEWGGRGTCLVIGTSVGAKSIPVTGEPACCHPGRPGALPLLPAINTPILGLLADHMHGPSSSRASTGSAPCQGWRHLRKCVPSACGSAHTFLLPSSTHMCVPGPHICAQLTASPALSQGVLACLWHLG